MRTLCSLLPDYETLWGNSPTVGTTRKRTPHFSQQPKLSFVKCLCNVSFQFTEEKEGEVRKMATCMDSLYLYEIKLFLKIQFIIIKIITGKD